jgi:nucleoside-diphosphate-sugar epimerase
VESAVVSGGAGFIGSHLCAALLARGLRVICIDNFSTGRRENVAALFANPRFTLLVEDVSRLDDAGLPFGPESPPRYIFQLASPASVPDYLRLPIDTLRANSLGTWHLLDLARQWGARYLFTSTSEIYGDPLVHPQTEDYWGNVSPNGPRSCYDESKRFGEALTLQYWRSYGVDARVVRIFNTYGPHSRPDDGRVAPNFIVQALAGEPITLYGTGRQTRSFCYVSDLVEGLIATMFTTGIGGEVLNLGNPEEHTIEEFARIVARLTAQAQGRPWLDSEQRIVWQALPVDDPTRRRPDIARARSMLGWEPRVSLEDGLLRTINWFREQIASGPQPARDGRAETAVAE